MFASHSVVRHLYNGKQQHTKKAKSLQPPHKQNSFLHMPRKNHPLLIPSNMANHDKTNEYQHFDPINQKHHIINIVLTLFFIHAHLLIPSIAIARGKCLHYSG